MNILVRKNELKTKIKTNDKLKSKKSSQLKDNNSIDDIFGLNKNEKIERIEKIDSHKIDYSINKRSNIIISREMVNNWNFISQPKPPPIDRLAATKIKLDKANIEVTNDHCENIQKLNNANNYDNSKGKKEKIKKSSNKTKLIHSIFTANKNGKESPKKIFPKIQIDLPSYDLEEKHNIPQETEEIKNVREKYENEIKEKKLEEIRLEKEKKEFIEKQKLMKEKRRKKGNKNVTVDAKGNLVFIKPINIDSLIKDFNIKILSDSKLIKKIKNYNINQQNYKNVEVEINNNPENQILDKEREEKNKNTKNSNIIEQFLESVKKKKNVEIKVEKNEVTEVKINRQINDKNAKIISGSNFKIMNLECGVNLTEKDQKKSGGRDYFHKYGRFSFDSFENQLYRTSNSFFTNQSNNNNYININIDSGRDSNEQKVKAYTQQQKNPRLQSATPSKMKEKIDVIRNTPPSRKNKYLYLKTKNLKSALSNLDLINENEKDFTKINMTSHIKLFNSGKNKRIKKLKRHLGNITKFNSTLTDNKFQAITNYSNKKKLNRKLPAKPDEKILKREVSHNQMKHLPRQRLPPILSDLKTYSDLFNASDIFKNHSLFKKKKKLKEIKSQNLSKDSLFENRKKYYLTSINGFFNNKKRNESSNRKNDEIKEYISNVDTDKIKSKGKDIFVTFVDFVFYDGEIKGITFNDLSEGMKEQLYNDFCTIDGLICMYIPDYKENISDKYSKVKDFRNNRRN